jgi:uncharacterized protein YraI
MKLSRAALAVAGASMLVAGAVAMPAIADTDVTVYGGTTTITTTPAALPKITKAGIVMWGADGATSTYKTSKGEARQQFVFSIEKPSNVMLEDDDVTNKVGSLTGGVVNHNGDVMFLNTNNGRKLSVGDFRINFKSMKVLATTVNGDPVDGIAVFNLVAVDPPIYPSLNEDETQATIAGVNVVLTGKGADALNDALNTKVFDGGLKFGKAVAVADIVEPAM